MAGDLSSSEDGSPISAINITPFVDVVLVLLVIFIVTAPTLMKDVINIKLPKAESSGSLAPSSVGIAVSKQGQILFNGLVLSETGFLDEVRKAVQAHPDAQAIISADSDARHGDVVRAIDWLKKAGLNRFAIQIDRQQH